jgi:hypothetical protein
MKRVLWVALIGIALAVAIAIAWVVVFLGVGRPILWEVPAGFRGWASVRHEQPQCPPARTRSLFLVLSALPDGHGCTSSLAPAPASRYYRLERVNPDGTRTRATIGTGQFYDASRKEWYLFVGTEEELKREGGPRRPRSEP